ncbi:MAG: hypothetical protein ACRCZ9_00745 [Fusobacteriaceae bacterium]
MSEINRIVLTFDKSLTAIAGYKFGEEIYEKQVEDKYKSGNKNIIEFPEQIDSVAISFVQGFLKKLLKNNRISKIKEEIEIVGNSKFVKKFNKVI